MSLRLRNTSEAPPGYWHYDIPELAAPSNHVGPCTNKTDLLTLAWQRYQANAILPPVDLEARVEDQMARKLHPMYSYDDTPKPAASPTPVSLSMRFGDVLRGTRILAEAVMRRISGQNPRVTPDQANQRAAICLNYDGQGHPCPEHVPVTGCASCVAGLMVVFVTQLTGGQKTSYDDRLQGCHVCGCALKGKVWIKRELLMKAMGQEQLDRFPKHCWLVQEGISNVETPTTKS